MMNCKKILVHIKLDKKIIILLHKQRPGFILQKTNCVIERTTLLRNVHITNKERNLLNIGPPFTPAQKISNNVRQQLIASILNLEVTLR